MGVVVTGIGMMGDWGAGKDAFLSFLAGRSVPVAVEDFDFDAYIDTQLVRRADHISRCALTASTLALRDADLSIDRNASQRIGVVFGTVHGALHYTIDYHASLVTGDPKVASPLLFSDSVPNAPVSHISTSLGIQGYTITTQGYCAVTQAVEVASQLISHGTLDVCLVGGADVNHELLAKFYIGCLRSPDDVKKTFGGSAFFVLESESHAASRKARVYANLEAVTMITATGEVMRRSKGLFLDGVDFSGCVLAAAYDDKESTGRMATLLDGFSGHTIDCSLLFGYGFAAAESFQIALAALGAQDSKVLAALAKEAVCSSGWVSLLRTALSGVNSVVVFRSKA
ncbi:MAG: hypothetical protein HQL18_03450 [Candidatus Omnitrophica bacterium]|nr:hypothetical protein [Candidatus Omnitrophota bacterium]